MISSRSALLASSVFTVVLSLSVAACKGGVPGGESQSSHRHGEGDGEGDGHNHDAVTPLEAGTTTVPGGTTLSAMTAGTGGTMAAAMATTSTSAAMNIDRFPDVKAVKVKVTAKGYVPNTVMAKVGQPLAIEFTRTEEKTCATEAIFDEPAIRADLPLNKPVRVSFVPEKAGMIVFGCHMGKMVAGNVMVTGS